MTLHVHPGPHLAPLADDWAARLATPLDDPLAAEVVAVPTAGVRDWLRRHLADRLGIAANIDMPFPGRFVATALGLPADADDPWALDRLTWTVLALLEGGRVDVPGWRQATAGPRSRRFAVARRIADLFDRYATNRPELLRQWRAGARGDGTVRGDAGSGEALVGPLDPAFEWQFHLWRLVRDEIGEPSPAERLPALLDALRSGAADPPLPARVGWFGTSNVPPARLAVLGALGAVRDVHLYVVHPSPAAWAAAVAQVPGHLVPRRRGGPAGPAPAGPHPLVRSWGRPTAELAALVKGLAVADPGGVTLHPAAADTTVAPPATLLSHLQADIVADRAPTRRALDPADRSVQVHAGHGVIRQLEVLRDALGHLFAADPTLQPHDVLVVCPDLARFQPFAAAVFARGTLPVPLTVTDLSLGAENPVVGALAELLRVATGRCTAPDVLALAGLGPVARRFGLAVDDVETIAAWITRLGTSWGLDAAHRTPWIGGPLGEGTWAATLSSLLLGAAMPAPEPRPGPAGVAPFDDMGADAVATAGRLAELVARLRHLRGELAAPRPAPAWCATLVEALHLFCAVAPAEAWQVAAVTEAIDEVRAAAAGGAPGVVLAAADVRDVVDQFVVARRGRLRLRSGAVTLTGFTPVRNVPARVVAIIGFDEESLRPPNVDGDDMLAVRPCVGEPDRRAERRQLLLDALLAAGEHLLVVGDGNDITTNRRLPFPVPLTELLDVIDATVAPPAATGESFVVRRHPLRSYDEDNFVADDGGSPFGFDSAMLAAARVRRTADDEPEPLDADPAARWSIGPAVAPGGAGGDLPEFTLAQLADACARPARTLVRDGLDVRLPGEVAELDALIPLGVTPLERAELGRRLLDRLRAASRTDPAAFAETWPAVVEQWREAESLDGRRPPRALSGQALTAVAAEVVQLVEFAGAASGAGPGAFLGTEDPLSVELVLAAARLVDKIDGVATASGARIICRIAYARSRPRHELAAALDLAAAVATTGDGSWRVDLFTRASSGPKQYGRRVAPHGGDPVAAAVELLEVAAGLRVEALTRAVPLFEKTSRQLHSKRVFDEELFGPADFGGAGDLDDRETGFVWRDVPLSRIIAMRRTLEDYADRLWGAVGRFATIDALAVPAVPARARNGR